MRAAARALLGWFAHNARSMEWRDTRDPYRIWVSEIMLQQTRVATVGPYYRRFLESFPDPGALAQAPLSRVLKAWEGLGYYSRAVNLHRAARIVTRDLGGRFPDTVEGWMELPGVGRSTAGAIAAIAFGRDAPILDANAKRVLARLGGVRGKLAAAPAQRALWNLSEAMILPGKGRETALAVMDLGSILCLPKDPACPRCPISRWCAAFREGTQGAIPPRGAAPPVPQREWAVAVIRDGAGRVFLRRRPPGGLLGGLWEFPGADVTGLRAGAGTVAERIFREAGIRAVPRRRLPPISHAYSHFRVVLIPWECDLRGKPFRSGPAGRWCFPRELSRLALSRAHRKVGESVRPSPGGPSRSPGRAPSRRRRGAGRPSSPRRP